MSGSLHVPEQSGDGEPRPDRLGSSTPGTTLDDQVSSLESMEEALVTGAIREQELHERFLQALERASEVLSAKLAPETDIERLLLVFQKFARLHPDLKGHTLIKGTCTARMKDSSAQHTGTFQITVEYGNLYYRFNSSFLNYGSGSPRTKLVETAILNLMQTTKQSPFEMLGESLQKVVEKYSQTVSELSEYSIKLGEELTEK